MDVGEAVESQIAAWSKERPHWQRGVLRRLATGGTLSEGDLETLADNLIADEQETVAPLSEAEVSAAARETETITLESLGGITNVNSLIEGETLSFDQTGLTVVYGHNASGKSGYARVIKAVSGALHEEPVHGNVFTSDGDSQQAEVVYIRDGVSETATWPDNLDGILRAVRFYDAACGNKYTSRESELTYRPSALTLLDGLIEVCGGINSILDKRLADNDKERGKLPSPPEGSKPAAFLDSLTATTTQKQIDDASHRSGDVDERLKRLSEEEARLRGSDPVSESKRRDSLAIKAETVSQHIKTLTRDLSDEACGAAMESRDNAFDLRAAAALASTQQFRHEPVTGVGADTWRAMWEAAREFSETEAYHDHEFPVTGADARCVLCHQELSNDGADRLARFEGFVQDQTEKRAAAAEAAYETLRTSLEDLVVKPTMIAEDLVALKADRPKLAKSATKWLTAAEKRREAVVARIRGEASDEPNEPRSLEPDPIEELVKYSKKQRATAETIDDAQFKDDLVTVTTERANLEGRVALSKNTNAVVAEVERLKKRAAIEAARRRTETGSITREATLLMNRSVTGDVLSQFRVEAQRMQLNQVELTATGGKKGKFRQRPALANLDTAPPIQQVLSEGEQSALGLAGFFTEAHFDSSRSAIVFDDPVTSLDHMRRENVAARIVEFAAQRQAIVFTHELPFVLELSRAAEDAGIAVAERRIERVGASPGKVGAEYPWNAQGVKERIGTLQQDLHRIKKGQPNWTDKEYEEACAKWAGDLSETWERLIHIEVVGQVFDTAKYEVRPRLFRILARITPEDDEQFQKSYGKSSKWARRHDKSPEINYVPPTPAQLEEQYELIRDWYDRVKRYRNS